MPFTGYLKIPDIDGESQAAAVIDRYASVLNDDTEALLKVLGTLEGADDFDFMCLTGTTKDPATGETLSLNFSKIEIDFTPTATGLEGLKEMRAYADGVEAMLADAGFDIDLAIKYDRAEGYFVIKMTDVLVSSYSTSASAAVDDTLTDTSDFDYFL